MPYTDRTIRLTGQPDGSVIIGIGNHSATIPADRVSDFANELGRLNVAEEHNSVRTIEDDE